MRRLTALLLLLLLAFLTGCASLATPTGYETRDARRARIMKRVAVDVATLGLAEVVFIQHGKQLEVQQEWDAYAAQLRYQVSAGQITQGEAQLLWQNAVLASQAQQQRVGLSLCVWQRGILVCL